MTCNKTCRTCKHWTAHESSIALINRATTKYTYECPKILNLIGVNFTIYGDASVSKESLETSGEFGCIFHEPLEGTI